MRLVYLGSPEVAVNPLRALVEAGHDVALVVSQPDRKRGRGAKLVPSPVKAAALELGLEVSDRVGDVIASTAELGVVVAFGRLIKPHVLAAVPMINMHFSLLPRWRGAAPVERAILAGDEVTGVCIMALEEGLDTGPVYRCQEVPVREEDTAADLRGALERAGTGMLLDLLESGLPRPTPQQGESTYAAKLEPHEHRLDWSRPATQVHRVIRLGDAWTTFRGHRFKIRRAHLPPPLPAVLGTENRQERAVPGPGTIDAATLEVATGDGTVKLVEVQPEGKPAQPATAWRNGAHLQPDDRFE